MAQDAVVPQADRDRDHGGDPDPEPQELGGGHAELDAEGAGARKVLREAVQHDHAEPAHRADRRQDQLVAAMAERDEQQVRPGDEDDVPDREGQVPHLEGPGQRDVGDDESEGNEQQDREEEAELRPAPGDRHRRRITDPAACGRARSSARRRS